MKNKELLKKIAYHLPVGALAYFHKQQFRYFNLTKRMDRHEAKLAQDRYLKASVKYIAGGTISSLPGVFWLCYTYNPIALVINFILSHNYSELMFGRKIEKWIEEYERII